MKNIEFIELSENIQIQIQSKYLKYEIPSTKTSNLVNFLAYLNQNLPNLLKIMLTARYCKQLKRQELAYFFQLAQVVRLKCGERNGFKPSIVSFR